MVTAVVNGEVAVAHGEGCVVLMRQRGDNPFAAVLTPTEARALAYRLNQQANYSESEAGR